MKIFWIILLVVVLVLATSSLVNYLLQRARQRRAEKEGTVVYATVLSVVVMRIQEPGDSSGREVTLRTRIPATQKISAGMRLAVMIDPKNPKLVYPASPDAAKRVVITGSRLERRQMRAQGVQRQQQPPRYQPPIKTGRR